MYLPSDLIPPSNTPCSHLPAVRRFLLGSSANIPVVKLAKINCSAVSILMRPKLSICTEEKGRFHLPHGPELAGREGLDDPTI